MHRNGLLAGVNIEEAFAHALRQQKTGQLAEAEKSYREILTIKTDLPEIYYNLGLVLQERRQSEEATKAYEQALELKPRFPEAINNLGATLESMGRLDEAEDTYRHALLLEPDSADVWNNLGGVLKDLGRLDESIECLMHAHKLAPDNARVHSNLVFTLHYSPRYNAGALLQAALNWNQQHMASLKPVTECHRNNVSPNRKLRVGYLSSYFRDHCQALFITPLLSHHDHTNFEIFCYYDGTTDDGITEQLRKYSDTWRQINPLDDMAVAETIQRDQIDILVDFTLHLAGHRLGVFARKPAPIQITWLGYPGTTGMKAIDYRFSDPQLDSVNTDQFYAEKSVRLPDSFWCYDPLTDYPGVSALPVNQSGYITFGCLNNFCKVTDAVLDSWAQILRTVPNSKLLLLAPPGATRAGVKTKLGLNADRLEFAAYQPRAQYLKLYHRIDLCLDTFPYNGHTTTLDSLWMGVPVVSLSGTTAVSRAGLSMMTNLGLTELVADNPAQFIRLATELAQDRPRLAGLRSSLRDRMQQSPLMDATRFAQNVEHAYRSMWQNWCANHPT